DETPPCAANPNSFREQTPKLATSSRERNQQDLRGRLADPSFQPHLLTLVSLLHVLEGVKELPIPQRSRGLLEHHQRHHALVHEQPKIVEIKQQIEAGLAAINEQRPVATLSLALGPISVLRH